jgi:hypothetical protein
MCRLTAQCNKILSYLLPNGMGKIIKIGFHIAGSDT